MPDYDSLEHIEAAAWGEKFLHAVELYHRLRQFDHIVPCGYVWAGVCGSCYDPDEGVKRPKRKVARFGSSTVRPICPKCDFAGNETIPDLFPGLLDG